MQGLESHPDDHLLLILVAERFIITSVLIQCYCLVNFLILLSTFSSWPLCIFNIINVIGALGLCSPKLGERQFNERGIRLYLVGCVKCVVTLIVCICFAFGKKEIEDSHSLTSKFFLSSETRSLLILTCFFDILYLALSLFMIQATYNILDIQTVRSSNIDNHNMLLSRKSKVRILPLKFKHTRT